MDLKFTNFATSTIADVGGIGAGDLTVNVQPGDGALFPSLAAGEYFYATMIKTTGAREIVKVTARATDALTIVRAQDNTIALVFDEDDKIELRLNSAALEAISDYFVGFYRRSLFTWASVDTITVGGGLYEVSGKLAKITSELTTVAHGVSSPDWAYLYIDYSAIPATGILTQSELIWSTTEPTWSHSKIGWYNGDDRCIFAGYVPSADELEEFWHNGDTVFMPYLSVVGLTSFVTAFAAISTGFKIPSFANICYALIVYDANGDTATRAYVYRPTGSSEAFGMVLDYTDEDIRPEFYSKAKIITGTDKKIDIRCADGSTSRIQITQYGYELPKGI